MVSPASLVRSLWWYSCSTALSFILWTSKLYFIPYVAYVLAYKFRLMRSDDLTKIPNKIREERIALFKFLNFSEKIWKIKRRRNVLKRINIFSSFPYPISSFVLLLRIQIKIEFLLIMCFFMEYHSFISFCFLSQIIWSYFSWAMIHTTTF